MTLTQKETMLLKDLVSQEQLCVEKYTKYSTEALDGQLKNLFNHLGQVERQHIDTLNQIMSGTVPSMNSGGSGNTAPVITPTYTENCPDKEKDKFLCADALAMEKHVSAEYNTCIFEFSDVGLRDVLNHIQKEEQEHGEKIYNYMSQNGMYNA